jgi:hypothetical protein
VPSEQLLDVRGKRNYLNDAPFECSPEVVDVAAFIEAMSIISGHDAVEEFLACSMWPLSDSCGFEVAIKETPLSRVVVPMPKVTSAIGVKETELSIETQIVNAANLLVGKYNVVEHNAYTRLQHGQLNHVFELAGVLCLPRLKPIPRKRKATTTSFALSQAP